MYKFYSAVLVLLFVLFITSPVQAIDFPSFGNFPFPSINPFPSKTPKPTEAPNPSSTPSSIPSPSASPTTILEILDVQPSSANFMQEFTLEGTNFGNTPGNVSFRYYTNSFSSGGAPIVSWSNNEIKAKVPAVKKGSYTVQVITSDNKKSNEVKFTVKNGQPIINSTSLSLLNGEYELIFQGSEFGSKRGSIDIYMGNNLAANGIIRYWSSSRIRFDLPSLPSAEYGFQITTSDGRKSSLKFFTVGN